MAGTIPANAGTAKEDQRNTAKGKKIILVKELTRQSRHNEL